MIDLIRIAECAAYAFGDDFPEILVRHLPPGEASRKHREDRGGFFVVVDEFIRDARNDALDAMTIVSLGALRDLAEELHAAIDRLPRGVWLWEKLKPVLHLSYAAATVES